MMEIEFEDYKDGMMTLEVDIFNVSTKKNCSNRLTFNGVRSSSCEPYSAGIDIFGIRRINCLI